MFSRVSRKDKEERHLLRVARWKGGDKHNLCRQKRPDLIFHYFWALRPCTHEQIKYHLFKQIRTELLHTDLTFEQINSIFLLHVYGELGPCIHKQINIYFIEQFRTNFMRIENLSKKIWNVIYFICSNFGSVWSSSSRILANKPSFICSCAICCLPKNPMINEFCV